MSVQVEIQKAWPNLPLRFQELEKALEKAYQKQKEHQRSGFRKGKFRRAMVEKYLAVFYDDAVNSLVPEEYSKQQKRANWTSYPVRDQRRADRKRQSFIFTATVAVKPGYFGEYKGLEVAKADTTVR